MGNLYQEEENWAKLVAFKQMLKKGMSDDAAWKAAESATFNYAQVTPFIRQIRTAIWGVPFITFPLKATPIAIEVAAKHPARVSFFGKLKAGIENLSDQKETEEERALEPKYIRDGFFVKLPIKDEHGRSAYFDLTYVIPFGDLMSGQLFERQISRKTGLAEPIGATVLSKNPVFNLLKEMAANQDFSGNKIVQESDPVEKQIADFFRHLSKTYLPPWLGDQLPGGYKEDGTRALTGFQKAATTEEDPNQSRTIFEEALKNLGQKVLPLDAEVQQNINEWNKRKALQTLLLENGVVSEFSNVYQPKE